MEIRKLSRIFILHALKNPVKMRIVLILLTSFSILAAAFGTFSGDISKMLPDHSRSAEIYSKILRSGMFSNVVIEFHLPENTSLEKSGLMEFLPRLEQRLRNMPELRVFGLQEGSPANPMKGIARFIPQLVPADHAVGNDAFYQKKAAEIRRRLLLPGQSMLLRNDPLSLLSPAFGALERFRRISGVRFSPRHLFPVSEDERHAMILLETSVPVSDPIRSKKMLGELENVLRDSPVSYDLITAHKRAAANETVLKRDLKIIALTSIILFALIFLLIYKKDFRSFAIPIIPFAASAIVLALMILIFKDPLLFVTGMGGIVISLAADYGIHIYSVIAGGRGTHGLFRIIPPLCAGAATSAAVFLLYLLSGTEGFRQFGFFAAASLLLSLLLMILILPPIFSERKTVLPFFRMPDFPRKHAGSVIFIWLILMIASALLLSRAKIIQDVRQFDAAPESCERAEMAFRKHFLSDPPSAILFQGTDRDEVESRAENALRFLKASPRKDSFFSPLELMPSGKTRMKNLESWKQLIRSGDFEVMKQKIRSALKRSGLPEKFAEPFFQELESGIRNPSDKPPYIFAASEHFRGEWKNYTTIAILFPDTAENAALAGELPGRPPIVSQDKLPKEMANDILNSMIHPAAAALILVILITFLYFRNLKETMTALLPVASSLIAAGAFFTLTGIGINIAVLTSAVILAGLAVDYGIFMTLSMRNERLGNGVFHAVTLSALTSAAGGCTVIFTTHPMLRYAGISLIVGISAAWLTGVFLLPALKAFRFSGKVSLLLVPLFFLMTSCATSPFEYEEFHGSPNINETGKGISGKFRIQSRVTVDFRFHAMTFLTLAEVTGDSDLVHIVALSPAGMKILDIQGTPNETIRAFWMKGGPWEPHTEQASRIVLEDVASIYRNTLSASRKTEYRENGKLLKISTDAGEFIYAGEQTRLIERMIRKDGEKIRRIRFYRYTGEIPDRIYMENLKYGYRLIIRTDRVEKLEK